jgi:primosomal protein N''
MALGGERLLASGEVCARGVTMIKVRSWKYDGETEFRMEFYKRREEAERFFRRLKRFLASAMASRQVCFPLLSIRLVFVFLCIV